MDRWIDHGTLYISARSRPRRVQARTAECPHLAQEPAVLAALEEVAENGPVPPLGERGPRRRAERIGLISASGITVQASQNAGKSVTLQLPIRITPPDGAIPPISGNGRTGSIYAAAAATSRGTPCLGSKPSASTRTGNTRARASRKAATAPGYPGSSIQTHSSGRGTIRSATYRD